FASSLIIDGRIDATKSNSITHIHGCSGTKNSGAATATVSMIGYDQRAAVSPRRTAKVSLPASMSVGMSRTLLAMSRAVETKPAPTAPAQDGPETSPVCVYVVPNTATKPKNTKTNTSPSPE